MEDTTFHLSQPPELFARVDHEAVDDEFGQSVLTTSLDKLSIARPMPEVRNFVTSTRGVMSASFVVSD